MPRDLPLGNGRLHINFDSSYQMRDLYFPHVGQENHTQGHLNRFGVWIDDQLSWIGAPEWERELAYEPQTLVTDVVMRNRRLDLTLRFNDAVDLEHDVWVRKVTATDERGSDRPIRFFLHFDGHLWGYADGDTAYLEPGDEPALIHYKGKRYLWFSGAAEGRVGYRSFATGNKEVRGREGTWRDAEDGELSGNPVAQGSVDSIGGLETTLPGGGEVSVYFWIAVGERYADVLALHRLVVREGPDAILQRARRYWRHWAGSDAGDVDSASLSERAVALYRQSLLILRTQIDAGGAILAANDSDILQFGRDTYSYMWPRDGALVTMALDAAGYPELTRRFFHFAHDLITADGFFLHKYNPDGSAGSTWHPWSTPDGRTQYPIQEDETALVLHALWHHYQRFNDLEMIRPLYGRFVVPTARFLASYRDLPTGLPAPSYDLWEERHGIHAFTTGAVWAGLQAAANFAVIFGDDSLATEWRQAAANIREAALRYLYSPELERFARTVRVKAASTIELDPTLDSSLCGLFQFGMLSPSDPRVVRTMSAVEQRLMVKTAVGGLARYEDDYYHQVSRDLGHVPGNPWFICTLWLADWYVARATSPTYLNRAQELIEWVVEHALPSGVLAEQVHPYTNQPLSVSPLTWSHATFIQTIQRYLLKERQMAQAGWELYLRG